MFAYRMGLLDFEFLAVTNETLKDKNWDSVILVCENLNWDAAFNSDLAYLKPAVVDALKVSYVHLVFLYLFAIFTGSRAPNHAPIILADF